MVFILKIHSINNFYDFPNHNNLTDNIPTSDILEVLVNLKGAYYGLKTRLVFKTHRVFLLY